MKLAVCPGRRPSPRSVRVLARRHSVAVDGDDDVAASQERQAVHRDLPIARPQAGRLGGAAGDDALYGGATLDGRPGLAGERRGERPRGDPDPGVAHLAPLDQLLHRAAGDVYRNRKADAFGVSRLAADLRVDADHLAKRVEEQPARVPPVDRGVDLDGVDDAVAGGKGLDGAPGSRHDAHGERARLAERASDRRHRLADDYVRRVTERHDDESMLGRSRLEEPDVIEQVPADDLGPHAVAVRELDVDLGCRLHCLGYDVPAARRGDHVGVREDVPVRRDDESRTLAFCVDVRATVIRIAA